MKNKKLFSSILKMLLAFTIFYFSDIIPHLLFKLLHISNNTINLITSYIFMSVLLILLYRKELITEWKNFKSKLGANFDITFKYYIIGFFGMIIINFILIFILNLGKAQNEQKVQGMIQSFPVLMLISAGLFAPITEEITFRTSLKQVFKNKWIFAIVSGILFGSAHVITYKFKTPLEILYILPYGLLGASFALMDHETDSTFSSIFAHMFHNTFITLFSILKVLL